MSPPRARRLAPVLLSAALGVGTTATAIFTNKPALATEPTRVVFVGAEGCPSDSDLVVAVAARGRAIVSVAAGGDDVLRVTLRKEASGYRGRLEGAGRAGGERELSGATCREVVEAMAIVVASALGPASSAAAAPVVSPAPTAVTSAAPPNTAPASTEPTASARASTPSAAPTAPSTSATEGAAQEAPNEVVITKAEAATVKQYRDFTFLAGGMTGPLPGTIVPRFDLEARRSAVLDIPGRGTFVVGPIVRMRVSYFGSGTVAYEAGSAKLQGTSVGLSPCLQLAYRRAGLSALLCPEFAAGVVVDEIQARGSAAKVTSSRPFSTFGVDGELVYALGPHMHLAAKFGFDGQLARLSGERSDGVAVYRSRFVSVHSLLGVGTTF
jgi:hypothetical protein